MAVEKGGNIHLKHKNPTIKNKKLFISSNFPFLYLLTHGRVDLRIFSGSKWFFFSLLNWMDFIFYSFMFNNLMRKSYFFCIGRRGDGRQNGNKFHYWNLPAANLLYGFSWFLCRPKMTLLPTIDAKAVDVCLRNLKAAHKFQRKKKVKATKRSKNLHLLLMMPFLWFSQMFAFTQFLFSLAAFLKVINIHTRLVKVLLFRQVIVTFSTDPTPWCIIVFRREKRNSADLKKKKLWFFFSWKFGGEKFLPCINFRKIHLMKFHQFYSLFFVIVFKQFFYCLGW